MMQEDHCRNEEVVTWLAGQHLRPARPISNEYSAVCVTEASKERHGKGVRGGGGGRVVVVGCLLA